MVQVRNPRSLATPVLACLKPYLPRSLNVCNLDSNSLICAQGIYGSLHLPYILMVLVFFPKIFLFLSDLSSQKVSYRYIMIVSWPGNVILHYWPFVRGIDWSPMDSPHKGTVTQIFDDFFLSAWISCWTNSHVVVNCDTIRLIWVYYNLLTASFFHTLSITLKAKWAIMSQRKLWMVSTHPYPNFT